MSKHRTVEAIFVAVVILAQVAAFYWVVLG